MHPVLLHTPWFTVYTYGLFVAIATLAGFYISMRRAAAWGLPKNVVADLVFFLFIMGIFGARLFYVLQHFGDYKDDLWHALLIQEGGLVWYGGFLAAATSGCVYARVKKIPVLKLCDFFSPATAFAHALGRVGCFFNGCCYGREAAFPLGVFFEGEKTPRIPTQAYEAAFLFLLSFYLFRLSPGSRRKDGEIFAVYVACYGLFRFLIEFLRGDQVPVFFLTIPQWISLLVFLAAVFFRKKISDGKF